MKKFRLSVLEALKRLGVRMEKSKALREAVEVVRENIPEPDPYAAIANLVATTRNVCNIKEELARLEALSPSLPARLLYAIHTHGEVREFTVVITYETKRCWTRFEAVLELMILPYTSHITPAGRHVFTIELRDLKLPAAMYKDGVWLTRTPKPFLEGYFKEIRYWEKYFIRSGQGKQANNFPETFDAGRQG